MPLVCWRTFETEEEYRERHLLMLRDLILFRPNEPYKIREG